jgi:hypothetical protein
MFRLERKNDNDSGWELEASNGESHHAQQFQLESTSGIGVCVCDTPGSQWHFTLVRLVATWRQLRDSPQYDGIALGGACGDDVHRRGVRSSQCRTLFSYERH